MLNSVLLVLLLPRVHAYAIKSTLSRTRKFGYRVNLLDSTRRCINCE